MIVLSILIATRDCPADVANCLEGAAETCAELGLHGSAVEFVFVDDCSAAGSGIVEMLQDFRRAVQGEVRILSSETLPETQFSPSAVP